MAEQLLFQLNPRLKAAADFVRNGKKFVDVGTDHAYLPIWLLKSGACPQAIGTDLREGPLLHAAHNAHRYRVQNKLILRLCNGLEAVQPNEADDVAIAGMGGELIAQIIQKAPWLKDPQKRLILQPMTAAEDLRRMLCFNGFTIQKERAVSDNGHVYTVMLVSYTGQKVEPSALFCFAGCLNPKESAEAVQYIRQQIRHLQNVRKGAEHAGDQTELERIDQLISDLSALF